MSLNLQELEYNAAEAAADRQTNRQCQEMTMSTARRDKLNAVKGRCRQNFAKPSPKESSPHTASHKIVPSLMA
jgi:hypothetical protein